jgi:RNA polymerase sigma-70 factor (ECF subfamily)
MALPDKISDGDLLRQLLQGDEEAFISLYRKRQAAVYRFALQMCGSESIAEDVTQEVFMTLMREGAAYNPQRGSVMAYLYGMARNFVLRKLERESRFVPMVEETDGDVPAAEAFLASENPLVELTRNETISAVRAAILALPTHYREVVVLCELNELSYAEAAEVLGCAIGTVRSRLSRARAILTDTLRSERDAEASPKRVSAERSFA